MLPADEAQELINALTHTEASVAVRVNAGKGLAVPPTAQRVPWCGLGMYLPERLPFTFDTDFQAGRYYVQDASSMFIAHVLRSLVPGPVRYLDLCAAPGGKTTAAIDALPPGSTVVANEVVPARARVLAQNVAKWGNPCAVVTSAQPRDWSRVKGVFDVVATDVPCSGEGMMRKEPEAVSQWSAALVQQCATLQRHIVEQVWPTLRPGGLLIYSTCTFNRHENELNVEHFVNTLDAQPVEVPGVDPAWNVQPALGCDLPCYRFMPHRTRGEGLFMAVLRKPGDAPARALKMRTGSGKVRLTHGEEQWLRPGEWTMAQRDGVVMALPAQVAPLEALLHGQLPVWHAGVPLGTLKGKNLVPHPALALSNALQRSVFPAVELDYATAMAFLRGEALQVQAPRGYVLVTHRQVPLGWVNNLGNRANNLWPKPWRVVSTHQPSVKPALG